MQFLNSNNCVPFLYDGFCSLDQKTPLIRMSLWKGPR